MRPLPEPVAALGAIAMNLRWSWDARSADLFRRVDAAAWEQAGHDPARTLSAVSEERLHQLAGDDGFLQELSVVEEDLSRYLEEPSWYQRHGGAVRLVGYFSPEFGLSEALPLYSGGLGILAGDHLKAASDLGVPMVGVGLLYRQGYFRQQLDADGWQHENYPSIDPGAMPLTLLEDEHGSPLRVEVGLAGSRCLVQLWRARVGRIDLILLDTDVDANRPEERSVTDRLYAGGSEHRLRQEIVLGIGGVRALRAAGYEPDVWHSNEGHAGFMGLERARELVASHGKSFSEAVDLVRQTTIFTTHTPLPVAIDVFEGGLMHSYFGSFAEECGVGVDSLMALGQALPTLSDGVGFNMAYMGLRLSSRTNAVSRLHATVSRDLFSGLWPDRPSEDVPITFVTNGVHSPSWLGPEIVALSNGRASGDRAESGDVAWDWLRKMPDAELWQARRAARERLVRYARERLRAQVLARGASEADAAWTDEALDPEALTIGFARRFAQYKRGTLMLADQERFKRLLLSESRPVQVVMAGKAHPLDHGGKEMIKWLMHFSSEPEVRTHFVFIEDYDMETGRMLTQGSDLWLNNPRRPLEACGTSGMKAAMNGVLNCSVLDGWWDECYDGTNGWAIGNRETTWDVQLQDQRDAEVLYDILETQVVPLFYDRPPGSPPAGWVAKMRTAIEGLSPRVSADRMLRDYVQQLYNPAAQGRAVDA